MSWTSLAAATALMLSAETAPPDNEPLDLRPGPPLSMADAPDGRGSAEITVLTYNVKGLPWPVGWGRAAAIRAIGDELAQMRREGRHPDVVLIQEGFRGEVADLVRTSGYRYWAQGPGRAERAAGQAPEGGRGWRPARYRTRGEGWGKFVGSGLHVLSDLPITEVRSAVYRYCAGFDCLANKGVMLARVSVPGGGEIDVVNTHLNSKRKAKVPMARTLGAHNGQMDELLAFLAERSEPGRPLVVGGDFNVKDAPDRYDYRAAARPYAVVSEFCGDAAAACAGDVPAAQTRPWLQTQDLQAFKSSAQAQVRPVRVDKLFEGADDGGALSDHAGLSVRYQLRWTRDAAGGEQAAGPAGSRFAVANRRGGVMKTLVAQRDD